MYIALSWLGISLFSYKDMNMELREQILKASNSPRELEILYRQDPDKFSETISVLFSQNPDSLVFQTWHERLSFSDSENSAIQEKSIDRVRYHKQTLMIILLIIITGTIVKIPIFLNMMDLEGFYSKNLAAIVIMSLIIYFTFQKFPLRKRLIIPIVLIIVSTLYLNILPNSYGDTFALSLLHMPFFFWSLLGVSFTGADWKDLSKRLNFIRYNGELVIYSIILLIGGGVLVGITNGLFGFIIDDYMLFETIILEYVLVYGLVALPIVATFLIDKILGKRRNIASILSKVFTPLFLLMVIIYLGAIVVSQKNPFLDREFLLTFNILLILVLAQSIFSTLERPAKQEKTVSDYINISLVFVTLIIDGVALSAILFRLTSHGLTPNRIAVLGANVLFFGHLLGIFINYIRFLLNRGTVVELENWISKYLPAYTVWVLFVAVAFPVIFLFR